MSNQSPTFRTSSSTIYGPRIYIDTDVAEQHLATDTRAELDRLSAWGGNTSSNSQKYLMWEFSVDGVNYAKAHTLLRTSGWQVER